MRLLVDQNRARRVAASLLAAGHDVVDVAERGLSAADDGEVLALAGSEVRVPISEDTDFGTLLARSGASARSFVLLRSAEPLTPDQQAALLIANLGAVEDELCWAPSWCSRATGSGCVVSRSCLPPQSADREHLGTVP